MASKTIYLVRHAQGYHNIGNHDKNKNLRDPNLTDDGKKQCEELCREFPHHDEIQLLLCSPLTRTIQTAAVGFDPYIKSGSKMIALPNAQECSSDPCNTGSKREELLQMHGDYVDFEHLTDVWYLKSGKNAPDLPALEHRGQMVRNWLAGRDEDHIVLVCHGDFLHHITGHIDQEGKQTGPKWKNAEYRVYTFASLGEDDGHYELIETQDSMQRREGREEP